MSSEESLATAADSAPIAHAHGDPAPAAPATAVLFRPLTVGTMTVKNRIVMAPMTRSFAPGGVLHADMTEYYRRRSAGGVGLIVTEGTTVEHPVAHFTSGVPHFYGAAALARWSEVVETVHDAGSCIIPQLWHTGLGRVADRTENPDEPSIAPSVVGKGRVREMTQKDIDDVIDAFGRGAVTARSLGFDGVAVHGAHGYLVDQFFWSRTNRRTDDYGGSAQNRLRFGVEMIAEMRHRVGPRFPIMFRFSQWKATHYDAKLAETPQELEAFLTPLADAGVDIFDASTRRFWVPEFADSPLPLAAWVKKLTGKVTMAVGSVGLQSPLDVAGGLSSQDDMAPTLKNLELLTTMMGGDTFDLIAVGRLILANPDLGHLLEEQRFRDLKPYNAKRVADFIEPAV